MQQAEHFKQESICLHSLLDSLEDSDYERPTQFKGWTVSDILRHLHLGNEAAKDTLVDEEKFTRRMRTLENARDAGVDILVIQRDMVPRLSGEALLDAWARGYRELAKLYASVDPRARVKWVGPEMSTRSSITARQMETWAHGKAVFDLFGKEREETDRIKNVVHLGVSTFGWTFVNRGLPIPQPTPYVSLVAPSGTSWTWNDQQEGNSISGLAVDFCYVVTQVRNIADTGLNAIGENARRWMEYAQCFVGDPQDPPPSGTRYMLRM